MKIEYHQVLIDNNELPPESTNDEWENYVIDKVCKKANRLGLQKLKIMTAEYKPIDDGLNIEFICEVE